MTRIGEGIAQFLELKPEDQANVRKLGWNTVAAYAPENEAEAVHASRIVSLSHTELALLRDADKPEQRLEYFKLALSVNRNITALERELLHLRRFGREEAGPIRRAPARPPDPETDAQIEALAAQAFAAYRAEIVAHMAAKAET